MTRMFRTLAPLALCATLALPLLANAEPVTLTGKLNGYNCVVTGYVCPIDKKDPVAALEEDFVLQLPDGKYYFLPNIDRRVKMRHFLDTVQVTGDLDKQYNSIKVEEMKQKEPNGAFKLVWSSELQERSWKELTTPGSTRP